MSITLKPDELAGQPDYGYGAAIYGIFYNYGYSSYAQVNLV